MSNGSGATKSKLLSFLQGVFYLSISIATIYGLWLNIKQTSLIYKPVIGITDAEVSEKYDSDENLMGIEVKFQIENVGNLPAKKYKINTKAKVGHTTLPYQEIPHLEEGAFFLPKTKAWNTLQVSKDSIEKMLSGKNCLYMIEFSFSDWEDYADHNYKSCFEIFLLKKDPQEFAVQPVSCKLMETES